MGSRGEKCEGFTSTIVDVVTRTFCQTGRAGKEAFGKCSRMDPLG